ncbi:MAG: GerW family sporulation protein [Clostridiales bacterium]|nr:GerW family sporulation protein [Clostridiales bacterium]
MSHPIENIMQSSMEHVKRLADVNTVIGTPIMSDDNTMILPVSKVSLGMLVGGGEYVAVTPVKKSSIEVNFDGSLPFIGASAVGMSLTPLAFLAVQNGTVRVLPAKQDCASDRLVDLIPQMIDTAERLIKELACGSKSDKAPLGEDDTSEMSGKSHSMKDEYSSYGDMD